ncbi:hypothetical protein EYB35_07315 [Bacillus paranthracis]|nr:hypothetical protein EYB35_07315 [Bacillus paranthracis]
MKTIMKQTVYLKTNKPGNTRSLELYNTVNEEISLDFIFEAVGNTPEMNEVIVGYNEDFTKMINIPKENVLYVELEVSHEK